MIFVPQKSERLRNMQHCRPALPKKPFPSAEIGPDHTYLLLLYLAPPWIVRISKKQPSRIYCLLNFLNISNSKHAL